MFIKDVLFSMLCPLDFDKFRILQVIGYLSKKNKSLVNGSVKIYTHIHGHNS